MLTLVVPKPVLCNGLRCGGTPHYTTRLVHWSCENWYPPSSHLQPRTRNIVGINIYICVLPIRLCIITLQCWLCVMFVWLLFLVSWNRPALHRPTCCYVSSILEGLPVCFCADCEKGCASKNMLARRCLLGAWVLYSHVLFCAIATGVYTGSGWIVVNTCWVVHSRVQEFDDTAGVRYGCVYVMLVCLCSTHSIRLIA